MNYNIEELKKLRLTKTFQEIGVIYGVSRETIRKLVGNTIKYQKYPEGYWRCYSCKKVLLSSLFYKSKEKPHTHRCIDCVKKIARKWMNKKYYKEYLSGGKYEQQMRVRSKIHYAIKMGRIKRGECFMKDDTCKGRLEAHHYLGYDDINALKIQWFCSRHHKYIDNLKWGRHGVL